MIKVDNNGSAVILKLTDEDDKIIAEIFMNPDEVLSNFVLQLAAHAMVVKDPKLAKKGLEALDVKQKKGDDRPAFEIFMEEVKQMCKDTHTGIKNGDISPES